MSHPTMTAEFIYGIEDVFLKTALEYIGDVLTEADKSFRRSKRRMADLRKMRWRRCSKKQ